MPGQAIGLPGPDEPRNKRVKYQPIKEKPKVAHDPAHPPDGPSKNNNKKVYAPKRSEHFNTGLNEETKRVMSTWNNLKNKLNRG